MFVNAGHESIQQGFDYAVLVNKHTGNFDITRLIIADVFAARCGYKPYVQPKKNGLQRIAFMVRALEKESIAAPDDILCDSMANYGSDAYVALSGDFQYQCSQTLEYGGGDKLIDSMNEVAMRLEFAMAIQIKKGLEASAGHDVSDVVIAQEFVRRFGYNMQNCDMPGDIQRIWTVRDLLSESNNADAVYQSSEIAKRAQEMMMDDEDRVGARYHHKVPDTVYSMIRPGSAEMFGMANKLEAIYLSEIKTELIYKASAMAAEASRLHNKTLPLLVAIKSVVADTCDAVMDAGMDVKYVHIGDEFGDLITPQGHQRMGHSVNIKNDLTLGVNRFTEAIRYTAPSVEISVGDKDNYFKIRISDLELKVRKDDVDLDFVVDSQAVKYKEQLPGFLSKVKSMTKGADQSSELSMGGGL